MCTIQHAVRIHSRFKDWGPTAATALYQDLVAAGKGQLDAVTPGAPVRGIENGGNTCYIDRCLPSLKGLFWRDLLGRRLASPLKNYLTIIERGVIFGGQIKAVFFGAQSFARVGW